jgi:hypothetical protein
MTMLKIQKVKKSIKGVFSSIFNLQLLKKFLKTVKTFIKEGLRNGANMESIFCINGHSYWKN